MSRGTYLSLCKETPLDGNFDTKLLCIFFCLIMQGIILGGYDPSRICTWSATEALATACPPVPGIPSVVTRACGAWAAVILPAWRLQPNTDDQYRHQIQKAGFLDWVLFANLKRIRLPGTEHMDSAYRQKLYHVRQSAIGMALGLIPCLLCGGIVALLAG